MPSEDTNNHEMARLSRVQESQAEVLAGLRKDVATILERQLHQQDAFARFVDREMVHFHERVLRLENDTARSSDVRSLQAKMQSHQDYVEKSMRRFLWSVVGASVTLISALSYYILTYGHLS